MLRIAGIEKESIVDGKGLRYTIFAQGCPHNCEGCHNPETHNPDGGEQRSTAEVIAEILANPLLDGVTLSGGEPFLQAAELCEIARAAKAAGLNIWTYSGWTLSELDDMAKDNEAVRELLSLTDVLIDGRFELENRTLSMKWIGSTNQRIIDMGKTRQAGELVMYKEDEYLSGFERPVWG